MGRDDSREAPMIVLRGYVSGSVTPAMSRADLLFFARAFQIVYISGLGGWVAGMCIIWGDGWFGGCAEVDFVLVRTRRCREVLGCHEAADQSQTRAGLNYCGPKRL